MKKIICLLMLLMLVTMTSCAHIEDSNGPDDYSLVTIKDEDIIKGFYSTLSVGSYKSSVHIDDKLNGTYKVSKLSGIVNVAEYDCDNETISFDIEFTCDEGNALVAIVSNGMIIKKIEANQSEKFDVDNNGKYYEILVIGESAKLAIDYTVTSK